MRAEQGLEWRRSGERDPDSGSQRKARAPETVLGIYIFVSEI